MEDITYNIGGRDINFDPRLGATLRIKKAFNKDYMKVIDKIDTMGVEDLIKLLHCGVHKNEELEYVDFEELCLENMGLGDLYDAVNWFAIQLQYPGISEEEFIKKMQAKAQAQKELTSVTE